jgi:hypothetical protein
VNSQPNTESFIVRHRFVLLFAALLIFYALVPVVHQLRAKMHDRIPPLIEGGSFIALLVASVVSIEKRPTHLAVAVLLGAIVMGLWIAELVVSSEQLEVARDLSAIAFFGHIVWTMLVFVLTTRRVTFNTICASLCIYLLLGLTWALAYSVEDLLNPNAFTWTIAGRPTMPLRVGKGDTGVLYFSFATLTTLGYGDIVPTSPTSRVLATTEAITGQLYLAVLVARLVGLQISESIEQRKSS